MEFKGTKGSWNKTKTIGKKTDKDAFWKNIISKDGNTICEVKGVHYGIPNNETIFNAKLISFAPEMLDMLKELLMDLDEIDYPTSMNDTVFRAEQLIKKAIE